MIDFARQHYILFSYIAISFLVSIYFCRFVRKNTGRDLKLTDVPLVCLLSFSWPVHIFGLIYLKATGKLID